MSCERRVKTFEEVEEVRIECCNREELISLEKAVVSSIEQKLEKLNIIIKNCDVYSGNGLILVNDRYNICPELTTIAEAFGLSIKQIQCLLRGKTFIITDDLLDVLKQLNRELQFGKNIANKELTDLVGDILKEHKVARTIDQNVLDMVNNIMKNGQYVTERKREVVEVYDDNYLRSRTESEWVSNEAQLQKKLMEMSQDAKETVNKTNAQLREGTAKLIYARAKQMGYAVQEIKKGTQTQLVLVRCE